MFGDRLGSVVVAYNLPFTYCFAGAHSRDQCKRPSPQYQTFKLRISRRFNPHDSSSILCSAGHGGRDFVSLGADGMLLDERSGDSERG